jgi:iron complex transport system permease protein
MERTHRIKLHSNVYKVIFLAIATFIIAVVGLCIGSVPISFADLFNTFFSQNVNDTYSQIIFEIRLPRVMLAIAVGGGLSVVGGVFQAILMNPLAEPYILGISSGGAFGAVISFLLGTAFIGTQLFAFAGALLVIFLVFMFSKRYGEIDPTRLLLSGVMIGSFFAAAILLMMNLLNDSLRSVVFWLMGNLATAEKQYVYFVFPFSLIISFFLMLNAHKYNVMALGSENAKYLGVNVKLVNNVTYILSSFLVGSIVSVSGIIGFVGLLIPHLCRLIFGIDNRLVIPASFFIGASYIVIADTIARTVIAPAELPVGAITALIGAPVFIYLMRKKINKI